MRYLVIPLAGCSGTGTCLQWTLDSFNAGMRYHSSAADNIEHMALDCQAIIDPMPSSDQGSEGRAASVLESPIRVGPLLTADAGVILFGCGKWYGHGRCE